VRGGARRLLAPELVDEPINRNAFVRPQYEEREDRALLCSAEVEQALARPSLEWPEHAELDWFFAARLA
jgi:hypothetical protein